MIVSFQSDDPIHKQLDTLRYSERRLENACSLALQSVASPRYSHIRPILETGQDMTGGLTETSDDGAGGWVRGGDYYANMGR